MTLPPFLDRAIDAATPLLDGLTRGLVRERLEGTSVALVGGAEAARGSWRCGFLLAANLLARLYGQIGLVAPEGLASAAMDEMLAINPLAEIVTEIEPDWPTLFFESQPSASSNVAVSVYSRQWNVYVDRLPDGDEPPSGAASLLAGAVGVAEIFRMVFVEELGGRGRRSAQPGAFNLVTLADPIDELSVPDSVDLGRFNLVGAGAIGQAAVRALMEMRCSGTMVVIDRENVELPNLQRYVLTSADDTGRSKVDIVCDVLRGTALQTIPVTEFWSAEQGERRAPSVVCLDSPEDRIGVQASLPGPIYNAWTQPEDVGWSRHEDFGQEPCLACLYWPRHKMPSEHEHVAEVFRQHPLRVLRYLTLGLAVGVPLPAEVIQSLPGLEAPADAARWTTRSILEDIAAAAQIDIKMLEVWRPLPLRDVFQKGICAGALLSLNIGAVPREAIVPLAHQSAIAGVMVATQLVVASVPELARRRPQTVEGRYDVLRGLPQVLARPRAQTQGCICQDPFFLEVERDLCGT